MFAIMTKQDGAIKYYEYEAGRVATFQSDYMAGLIAKNIALRGLVSQSVAVSVVLSGNTYQSTGIVSDVFSFAPVVEVKPAPIAERLVLDAVGVGVA